MCDIYEFKRRLQANIAENLSFYDDIGRQIEDDYDYAKELAMKLGIWTENGEIHENYRVAKGTNYTRAATISK